MFDVYYKSFRYDIAGLVILSIVLVVIACELTSNFVRRKVICCLLYTSPLDLESARSPMMIGEPIERSIIETGI